MAALRLEAGISTISCPAAWPLRMRVSMSAMGSDQLIVVLLCYQDALVTPGILPWSASSRKQRRQSLNLRM